eukprot:NODE_1013_length_2220_cov_0.669967.p2 type:complete len:167 gc:universal NODE_1013_length_2220_cov_0.669967:1636-1136(-)
MLHNSFEDLNHEEKVACLMLMKFRKQDLRIDSKQSSLTNLFQYSKDIPDRISNDEIKKPRQVKLVKLSPSKSRSLDKIDRANDFDSNDKSQCSICMRTFNRKYELERHLKTVHVEPVKCAYCLKHLKLLNRKDMQKKHLMFRCNEFLASGDDVDILDLQVIFTRLA